MVKSDTGQSGRDYSDTLFLPKTEFPMRAGLPKKEPEILARWERLDLFRRLRDESRGREKFVLHDGPPYANGHLHLGHALNKILKDVVSRSRQMLGYDAVYVPGWDCHGLPIEWKIEERYRAKGLDKDRVPILEFRRECREFAAHWVAVQSEEFVRLGVCGDFANPYLTMDREAEAIIAAELMKFARSQQLYRGSKPVMWSVVEGTALAEAEVEYQDFQSDTIWTRFPAREGPLVGLKADIVIWTTTPWTIPGNRAISYSPRIAYGLYEVLDAPDDNWARSGDRFVLADGLAEEVMGQARVTSYQRRDDVTVETLAATICSHPLKDQGYGFEVPVLAGDHVTDEAGTGFVHTAPGHGREDFEIWMENRGALERRGIDTRIPYTVAADGRMTSDAPGFEGAQVIDEKGRKGDANGRIIEALAAAGALIARGRLKHQYPHSWRSKKPVIFRNTPQWFIAMDKPLDDGRTLRERALACIDKTRFAPTSGHGRLRGMIENRPDWVVSRQRAWGVPITLFVNRKSGEILDDRRVDETIREAFIEEGADAWFDSGAAERFLAGRHDPQQWEKVEDILDVWFDSGSTHAFVLEQRDELKWPADVYLEGSDQHRGWFQSSLLESCGTRGRAPYDTVVTHGFTVDEDGRKMSKSLGNQVMPQDIIKQYGADILRLWVVSVDYAEDQRIGPEIIKTVVDAYRKLRNTMRWMLGTLHHFTPDDRADHAAMPELERLMLHQLVSLDRIVRDSYDNFDFKRLFAALNHFMSVELSSFYFDVRKDALYCDAISSGRRRAALTVIDLLFDSLIKWLAPMLPFTCEEAWLSRHGEAADSIHAAQFAALPAEWHDDALAAKWEKIRKVRRVVTGALEIERVDKRIGSSLEAAVSVHIEDEELASVLAGIDLAELAITSQAEWVRGEGPSHAFRLAEVPGVSVVCRQAEGTKCARSWRVLPEVGSDPDYPDVSLRDAAALRELESSRAAAQ